MHDTVGIINQFPSNEADNFDDVEATTSSAPQINDNENGEEPTHSDLRLAFNSDFTTVYGFDYDETGGK
ncbi:hypothetical protein EVAR_74360_1 [Eumeta japonica]|uniref:Uncharacterized protein n=1 Tax=Eumeta variegata TaxID=151549 RepID=A0A4C1SD62_EUMVA|nr:hypothetical protein EVAR_74360_1 [Eumeta japonica]